MRTDTLVDRLLETSPSLHALRIGRDGTVLDTLAKEE